MRNTEANVPDWREDKSTLICTDQTSKQDVLAISDKVRTMPWRAHSCIVTDTETSLVEQLTKTFGSKLPTLSTYLSTVVYCSTSEIPR